MGGLTDVIKSDLLPLVAKSAPLLGTVLGSPLAGVAVSLIASAFGVDPKNVTALTSLLSSSPDASLKLKELEFQHCEMLTKIASTDYATEVDDRKDARQYGVQYKDFMRHMAYLVTIGFFAALFALFLNLNVTGEEKNLLSMLVGMLASKWQTIIDFFFGSSRHNSQGVTK
jgi:hypothetical protein